jgi:hypothetical protein
VRDFVCLFISLPTVAEGKSNKTKVISYLLVKKVNLSANVEFSVINKEQTPTKFLFSELLLDTEIVKGHYMFVCACFYFIYVILILSFLLLLLLLSFIFICLFTLGDFLTFCPSMTLVNFIAQ